MSYALTLGATFFINLILILSVNLQLGLLGLPNLGFIIFMGAGAYAVGLFSMGPPTALSLQHYFFGTTLPFPIPLLLAVILGMVLAAILGALVLRKLRGHYLAIITLILVLAVWTAVNGEPNFLGGANGIYGIPQPFHSLSSSYNGYGTVFLIYVAVLAVICFFFAERFSRSPMGRAARAIRENESGATALGKNPYRVRMIAVICGGGMAALSGALLAQYVAIWTPTPWSLDEIFPAVGAMIIGGRGNNWGAALGCLVVDIGVGQGITFIPAFSSDPGLTFAFQWIVDGVLLIAFLWFRPKGLLPERKARWPKLPAGLVHSEPVAATGAVAAPALGPTLSADAATSGPLGASSLRPSASADTDRPGLGAAGVTPVDRRTSAVAGANADGILSCRGVSVAFGGLRAVDDVSLSVERGSITGLIGPNGAGKSTLVNVLSGHLRRHSGRVVLDSHDVTAVPAYGIAQRGLMRTFQLSSEFARLTVLDNMMVSPREVGAHFWGDVFYPAGWRRRETELLSRARGLLDEFGLLSLADEYAGNLSGGQKRLLELARALMAEPKLLLLDEPMAGVAPGMVDRLIDRILDINRTRAVRIMIVEHDLEVIDRLCSKVLVMIQGRVAAEGNMRELREDEQVIEAYLS
jgi:ABC-type branched-subunit amino acid transport system ATPase component/ABC-type branched-subunit amino acid transport system permease subunit